jgi:RNA polymerase sigma-70 factor (ECF subfamily)
LSFSPTRSNAGFLSFGLLKTKLLTQASIQDQDSVILEHSSDEALMVMLGKGRQEAIGYLFRRHARNIHAVGKRVLHDATEAEDLVQEVFLYLFRKSHLYDPAKGSARSWLVQIAYTQAFIRKRKLKPLGFYVDCQDENLSSQSAPFECDRTLEALFGRNRWKSILEDLTGDQEQVLRLHFFEGYTFAEIAEQLGQSYANIRNHHYRGLEKLRKHLAENALNRR